MSSKVTRHKLRKHDDAEAGALRPHVADINLSPHALA
jgi:hypothetical protein